MKVKVLFVCLGNICRSPAAEGIFTHLVRRQGLQEAFEIDSAGISGYHAGERADARMRAHATRRGYQLTSLSRPVAAEDFDYFDYIIGMDEHNRDQLKARAIISQHLQKIHLLTDFAPDCGADHVPDPYYGGDAGFEHVLDLIETCTPRLLEHIQQHYPSLASDAHQ